MSEQPTEYRYRNPSPDMQSENHIGMTARERELLQLLSSIHFWDGTRDKQAILIKRNGRLMLFDGVQVPNS